MKDFCADPASLHNRGPSVAGHTALRRPPIDEAHLDRHTFGDAALRHEVLSLFAAQASELVATVSTSAGDARRRAAHRLLGAARGIGATEVEAAAEPIARGSAGESEVAQLAAAVSAARAWIDRERAGTEGPPA